MVPYYEWFNKVLMMSANSVPIQSLWVAFFANPVDLNRAVQTGFLENGFGYYTLAAGAAINTAQGGLGALFANSVTIPGDGMNVAKLGSEGSGLIKGNISNGRMDMENLSMSFLDTNMSFCDYNLRPWAIYASHKSLKDPSVKTTIIVMQLAKAGSGKPLMPRAIWTFHDACPVAIHSQEWNYGGDNVVNRQVDFAYNYYTLNADPIFTAAQSVVSVLNPSNTKYKSQPVSVTPGGLEGHGGSDLVTIPSDSIASVQSHSKGQPVVIPEDDMMTRIINAGLNIINGNSNVVINSDDAINRLRSEADELLQQVKIPTGDVPERSQGGTQVGFIEKTPTGPTLDEPDHITRQTPEREQSGKIILGGNSKANAKDNADTPLFFPGDGGENSKKITGRTAGGESDTPNTQSLTFNQVNIKPNGDVGRRIPMQIINIKRDDMRTGGAVNSNLVNIDGDDSTPTHGTTQLVNVASGDNVTKPKYGNSVEVRSDDTVKGSGVTSQIVSIKTDDSRK